ncbi:MAG TPA: hypothetical protein VK249_34170, partial [Anaerolineales bacterium]|nr:hypothetical protein [Anaerolineales bacterium]
GVSEKNESGTLRTPQEIANKIQDMVKQSEKTKVPEPRIPVNMAEMNHPAQLAFLSSEVEATLILNEVTS